MLSQRFQFNRSMGTRNPYFLRVLSDSEANVEMSNSEKKMCQRKQKNEIHSDLRRRIRVSFSLSQTDLRVYLYV